VVQNLTLFNKSLLVKLMLNAEISNIA